MLFAKNLNCFFNYVIPNVLNASLVLYFFCNDPEDNNGRNYMQSGILFTAVYMGIFSNLFQEVVLISFIGCMLSGLAVAIMWPGSISLTSASIPQGGTALFALLALAGDVGGTVGPSIVGLCTGSAENNIQSGLLAASVFPVLLVICLLCIRRRKLY